jgi:hypothetical protein
MGLQNRDPVLFFEDDLQSLSLHNFMFGPLPVENDLLELIIRHKSTLTHLHLVEFSVDSEDSQTWSAILQTFERELTCLRSFSLVNQCYQYPDPGRAYMVSEQTQDVHDEDDLPALERLRILVESRQSV